MATESYNDCTCLPRGLWGTAWDGPSARADRVARGIEFNACNGTHPMGCDCPGEGVSGSPSPAQIKAQPSPLTPSSVRFGDDDDGF